MIRRPTFLEFFCGGGFARLGLEPRWECLLANDISRDKGAAYAANFGADHLMISDISTLSAEDLPTADLAWSSFPCTDLSLAGARQGMSRSTRSGTYWAFHDILRALQHQRRSPRLVVLENVVGALTSTGGADFDALVQSLAEVGYRTGALVINASAFVPQSRPRLFVIGVHNTMRIPHALLDADCKLWTTPALDRATERLSTTNTPLIPLAPSIGPQSAVCLTDILDGPGIPLTASRQRQILASVTAAGAKKITEAATSAAQNAKQKHGVLTIRTRTDTDGARKPRAEPRFDGLAGCLRTPGGGSSHQLLVSIEPSGEKSLRRFTPRECARLMGAPDSYVLPASATQAYKVCGDAVSPPVVRFLDETLLTPLVVANRLTGA